MRKNKIEGIIPFNEFFFRSCYYQQLIAGLSCFGIDKDVILFNTFTDIGEDFVAGKEVFFNEIKLGRKAGYKRKKTNINLKKLKKCIDNNQPIIVGVDCFYLKSRPETFMQKHNFHFILVYGYDMDNDIANVVDHDYINSFNYTKKEISLSNLLMANKGLRKSKKIGKRTSFILIKKKKQLKSFTKLPNEKIKRNQINSEKNLDDLKRLLTSNLNLLKEKEVKIIKYLQDVKTFYLALSKMKYFCENSKKQFEILNAANGYSYLLALLMKLHHQKSYDFISKRLDEILRKINEIRRDENSVYNYLLDEGKIDE